MSINIVEEAFGSFQIGYGASVAVVMTVVILIITGVQLFCRAAGPVLRGAMEPRKPRAGSTGHHRRDDRPRHFHAAAVRLAFLDVVPLRGGRLQMPPSFIPPSLDFKNYVSVLASSVPFLQIYLTRSRSR